MGLMDNIKRCRTCKLELPLQAFAEHNMAKDGRRRDCRECLQSGRRKPYIETPEQRARRKKRQARTKWQYSHRRALARHAKRFPKAAAACRVARQAFRAGRIERPAHCQAFGCTQAHPLERHHNHYDRPLEVIWVCPSHHRQGHSIGLIRPAPGIPVHLGRIPERA